MPTFISAVFDGELYLWNGKRWYDKKTHLEPPTCISSKLHAQSAVRIAASADIESDLEKRLHEVRNAQRRRQIQRTLQVVRQVRNKSYKPAEIATAL